MTDQPPSDPPEPLSRSVVRRIYAETADDPDGRARLADRIWKALEAGSDDDWLIDRFVRLTLDEDFEDAPE